MLNWTLRSWLLSCVGIAVLIGGWHEIWRPHRSRFVTKPRWIGAESDEQMDRICRILQSQAPEISGKIQMHELVRILNDIYPTRLDPESNMADEWIDKISVGDVPMRLDAWLKMILEPHGLTCSVRHGHLFISEGWSGLDRVYPCPVVDSRQLIQSLEVRGSDWYNNGGQATICAIDTDQQSLLMVRADLNAHVELERELAWYYESSGIGWRTNRVGWQNLPRILMDRIARWISVDDEATRAPRGMGNIGPGGVGCM